MYDYYDYLSQLHQTVTAQQNKIHDLEKKIFDLNEAIRELQSRAPTHIEKIDYHFDQLKIETLDGTLNIGINPNDLQTMDELSVNGKPLVQLEHLLNKNQNLFHQVQQYLYQFIGSELPSIIEKHELNPSFIPSIQQDIIQQLPQRIQFYLNRYEQQLRGKSLEEQQNFIISNVKKDIEEAIQSFKEKQKQNDGNDAT